jgi:hypothetical protein
MRPLPLVPLASLEGEKMENVLSALNRATRQRKMSLATATDEKPFYVWRTEAKKSQTATPPTRYHCSATSADAPATVPGT